VENKKFCSERDLGEKPGLIWLFKLDKKTRWLFHSQRKDKILRQELDRIEEENYNSPSIANSNWNPERKV
jgi:hypothetical protein